MAMGSDMPRPTGICPKCGKYRDMTYHHIFPRFHFPKQQNAPQTYVCRDCHNELEWIICKAEGCGWKRKGFPQKQEKHVYVDIVLSFYDGIDIMKWANIHARDVITHHKRRAKRGIENLKKSSGKWRSLREIQAML